MTNDASAQVITRALNEHSGDPGFINPAVLKHYRTAGYTEEHRFAGEYLLLVDPKTLRRVRLYENGQIWEQNEHEEYHKVKHDETSNTVQAVVQG